MNFCLTKNTSRARWRLKKLSVNLKQVCVPLIIADGGRNLGNFPPHVLTPAPPSCLVPHPLWFLEEGGCCICKCLSSFNLSVARDYPDCILGVTFLLLKRRWCDDNVLGLSGEQIQCESVASGAGCLNPSTLPGCVFTCNTVPACPHPALYLSAPVASLLDHPGSEQTLTKTQSGSC